MSGMTNPTGNVEIVPAQLIPISEILIDTDFNCRDAVTPSEVSELAQNIWELGLVSPVCVRPIPARKAHTGKKYQLVAGYRRIAAFIKLQSEDPDKFSQIPAAIHNYDDKQALFVNLSENVQRAELNILEETKTIQRLMKLGMTHEEIASKAGKSRGWVSNRLRLAALPQDMQNKVVELNLDISRIKQLYDLKNPDQQYEVLRELETKKARGEKLTIAPKAVKEEARKQNAAKQGVRTNTELMEMLEFCGNVAGYGILTRALAWAANSISTDEFKAEVAKYAANIAQAKEDGTYVCYDESLQISGISGAVEPEYDEDEDGESE